MTRVKFIFPWWGRAYILACCTFAVLMNLEPDRDKIARTVARHIKTKVVNDGEA